MTKLERVMRRHGIRTKDLAIAAKVSTTTIRRAMNGQGVGSVKATERIVRALGDEISPEDLRPQNPDLRAVRRLVA